MLKRAFSSAVADFVQISSKRKLPALFKDDTDRDIRDIKGFFEYIMDMAQPHPKLPDRLLLGQANLRKLAILANKTEDAKVLQTAFWTYCGHKNWPTNSTIEMIVQAMINIDAPEDAADKALHEKSMWQPIRDAFKIVEASDIPKKNEQTYLMSIDACIELKDWKWARRFHSRGSQKLEFSPEFNEIVDSLRSDLTEEELKDFRLGKKDKQ